MNKLLLKKLNKNKRKSNLAIFLKILSIILLFGLIGLGFFILIIRYFELPVNLYYMSGGTVIAACFIIALLRFRNHGISKNTIASIIDKESSANGLLLTSLEMNIGVWEKELDNIHIPQFRYSLKKDAAKLLYGFIIAAICFFIPLPAIESNIIAPLDISSSTEEIIHNVNTLAENGLLTELQKEEILEILKDLRNKANALEPSETFESLNSLEESIENIAQQKINDNISLSEQMNEVTQSLAGIDSNSIDIKWNELNNNLSALGEMLKENTQLREQLTQTMALNSQQLMENLSEHFDFSESMDNIFDANSESMEALRKALEEAELTLGEGIQNSMLNGSIDPESLEALQLLTKEQLKELLEQGILEGELETYMLMLEENGAGTRGGGPGDRDFTNTEKDFDTDNLVQLDSEVLGSDTAEYLGYSFAEPEIDIIKDNSGGILGLEIDEGGVSRRIFLAPHQRQAVEEYFNRENK